MLRPVALRLGGSPTPGLTEGLQQALEGMTVGGTRSVTVPASLGFGGSGSLAPYAFVAPGANLNYSVELLRLSTVGPDNLMSVGGRVTARGKPALHSSEQSTNILPCQGQMSASSEVGIHALLLLRRQHGCGYWGWETLVR